MIRAHFATAVAAVIIALFAESLGAQSAENVAVIINDASPASQTIGEYYVKKRGVPQSNVIRIRTATTETIDRAGYLNSIEGPIGRALSRESLQDRILYIVLTKGIPLRVEGTAGPNATVASVDSELTGLYLRLTGRPLPMTGRVANPYFLGSKTIREARPFTRLEQEIYLVTRLDAFTVADVLALIDRAQTPSSEGVIVLDQRAGLSDNTGDEWLADAARRLEDLGHGAMVRLDRSTKPAATSEPVLGYYSWGSNDSSNRNRRFGLRFVNGALAATFVSSDARTFEVPPEGWTPSGDWKTPHGLFAGSPQSLIGDLIREGATGVAGHVAEPYLHSTIRPQIVFPTYLAGFNLAEAFYLAMPALSWQTVVIGDPLCVPVSRKVLSRTEIEGPIDQRSGLPGIFRKRRIEALRATHKGVSDEALELLLTADARETNGDTAGLQAALEEATKLAPEVTAAQLRLALLYDSMREYQKAVERYRIVVEAQPRNALALNNLAYNLGVHLKSPKEALPFARQAASLASDSGSILDTLGWLEHLAGNTAEAAKLFGEATRRSPNVPDIRVHAAIVFAEAGAWAESETHLKEAVRLDPALEKRADVANLQRTLAERRK